MKVYIVWGETGEYENRDVLIAKIFKNKAQAELFMIECQKYANYMMEKVDDVGICTMYYFGEYNSPDKNFSICYTGTRYFLTEEEVE